MPAKNLPRRDETAEERRSEESDSDEESTRGQIHRRSKWANADEITDEILEQATVVKFTRDPNREGTCPRSPFQIQARRRRPALRPDRQRLARPQRLRSRGEFHATSLSAPELPQEIEIQGDGGLLALSGERKLSIRSRGVPLIKFEIDRVLSTQINHLVSQTEGEFQAPEFKHASFDQDNISRIAREDQPISLQNKWKSNYSAFDFSQYLQKPADGGSERGLFFLKASGWDPVAKKYIKSATHQPLHPGQRSGPARKEERRSDQRRFCRLDQDRASRVGRSDGGAARPKRDPGAKRENFADGRVTFASVDKNEHEKKAGRLRGAARVTTSASFPMRATIECSTSRASTSTA